MTSARPIGLALGVSLAGALGSGLRYGLGELLPHSTTAWPFSTWMINLLGAFLIGWLYTAIAPQTATRRQLTYRTILGTGFLGGFTTYSTFSLEVVQHLQHGQFALALGYTAASLILGVAAAWLGSITATATTPSRDTPPTAPPHQAPRDTTP